MATETAVMLVAQATVDASAESGAIHATTEAHGGEHAEVFPPFDSSTFGTQLIWLAITFVVLFVVMSRLALPRIGTILDNRKDRVDGDLAAADTARQKTDAAIAAYEEAHATARAKSHAIAEETRNAIKADIDAKRKAVEADLSKKVAAAEASIQATKTEALGHVSEIATDTVQELVRQLTGSASIEEASNAVTSAAKE